MDDKKNQQELFQLKPWNRGVSDEEILDDIRRVCQSLNLNTLTYEQYHEHGRFSDFVMRTRFGSWNNTLIKAGFPVQRLMNISEEKLFENIEQVWIKLGRQPRREEMRKPFSLYYGSTYEKRFGTWRKALEEFVSYISSGANEISFKTNNANMRKKTTRQPNMRMRFQVMLRDDFKCKYCGKSPATHTGVVLNVDHIFPWSEGGETTIENLQTLCMECNLGKSNLSVTTEAGEIN